MAVGVAETLNSRSGVADGDADTRLCGQCRRRSGFEFGTGSATQPSRREAGGILHRKGAANGHGCGYIPHHLPHHARAIFAGVDHPGAKGDVNAVEMVAECSLRASQIDLLAREHRPDVAVALGQIAAQQRLPFPLIFGDHRRRAGVGEAESELAEFPE